MIKESKMKTGSFCIKDRVTSNSANEANTISDGSLGWMPVRGEKNVAGIKKKNIARG